MTRDPLRWIDDPAIDPLLREAVRAARDVAPSFDAAAALARLESGIGAGAGATSAGTLAAGAALALTVIAGLAWWSADLTVPPHDAIETSLEDRAPHAPVASSREAAPPSEAPSIAAIETPRAEFAPPSGQPAEDVAPPRRRTRGATADESALAHEIAQLADARRVLPSDPARALELLDDGRERYASSIFAEERQALRVLALAGLDRRSDARAAGDRFLAAHPASPFAERIRRAMAGLGAVTP